MMGHVVGGPFYGVIQYPVSERLGYEVTILLRL
jgi:hypothetical protein